jgi:putative endonuclease
MTRSKQQTGQRAEIAACQYLQSQGLRLVEKNYSCKQGEIDLIMKDDEALIFIEVRYRKSADFGSSLDTITASKQRRIIRSAQHYLQQHHLDDQIDCRLDAIGLDASDQIIWIKDAFQVQY